MSKKSGYKAVAADLVTTLLQNGGEPTIEGLSDIWFIKNNNDEVLLSHLKALVKIFTKAIEEIEHVEGSNRQ